LSLAAAEQAAAKQIQMLLAAVAALVGLEPELVYL
jgi:hypothetical protein